ncbi:MAG TPA: GNAT family N-acetyltransferase [Actinocatenispora sp.]
MEIRRLLPDDWELFREVRLASLSDAPYAFASTVEQEAAFDEWQWRSRIERATWFAAVADGRSVGLVGGFVEDSGDLHLIGMWVAASLRGGGVAARLVDTFLAWARERPYPGVLLWVADGNDRARRFYERFGFRGTGERQPLPSDPSVGEEQYRLPLG